MNVCIIGDGLVSFTLAKALVNKKIKVYLYSQNNKKIENFNRTIGISSNNLGFFNEEIIKLKKNLFWKINEIEIFKENKKILNFEKSKKDLFSIIKNNNLNNFLIKDLLKNNYFKKIKIKNNLFYSKILNSNKFNLIINCESENKISKKYFYKKIFKNYNSKAYASIINHEKIDNKKAVQVFTDLGPIAFLPISEFQTSVVYSIKNQSIKKDIKMSQEDFKKLILNNNKKYKIKFISKFESFKLNQKILRNYYYKNILAFGDNLHKIHPLSGQGFNITLRDIRVLLSLIDEKINLGLPLDNSICKDFESKTKHLNFLFTAGNDFIYEFFNYDNYYLRPFSNKILGFLKGNKLFNNLAIEYADKGLRI